MMLTTDLKPKNADGQQSGQGNVNIVLCSRERQIPFYALEESREIMYTNFRFVIGVMKYSRSKNQPNWRRTLQKYPL